MIKIAVNQRTIYLRNLNDNTVSKWELSAATDTTWVVFAKTTEGTVRFTKVGYVEVGEKEYWEERWATLHKGDVIHSLYENNRIPFETLKKVAEITGFDWEGQIERMKR